MIRWLSLLAIPALAAAPVAAQEMIGTIERGVYRCELPGDAGGPASIAQPEESFTILSASRYSSPQGNGTYLRRGSRVTMTSGPRNGTTYAIVGDGFLRKIENGEPSRLRCIRSDV
ncbi:elongation factor P [Aurantiacibacter aquimixticola]|uniref:Elongation factor P n=1 Tax=Aurantiacibacter aquimixticola TaxID=1958945 RepID=A0A419RSE2_9SPHN|nr:elongation factor P [Aurantiacibacter aquimixticola]RJY08700.1 elongation factor P [Aurantiacibacter aquimixticola]